jgi:hypothetical protein
VEDNALQRVVDGEIAADLPLVVDEPELLESTAPGCSPKESAQRFCARTSRHRAQAPVAFLLMPKTRQYQLPRVLFRTMFKSTIPLSCVGARHLCQVLFSSVSTLVLPPRRLRSISAHAGCAGCSVVTSDPHLERQPAYRKRHVQRRHAAVGSTAYAVVA